MSQTSVEAPVQTAPAKRLPLWGFIVGGAVVLGSLGYYWWQVSASFEETDNATLIGNIHPVSSRINGTVNQVVVQDNQRVKPGDPLVLLDPRDSQLNLAQTESALKVALSQAEVARRSITLAAGNAQAQSTQADGGIRSATAQIQVAQAQVQEAKTGIPVAQAQLAQAEATVQKAKLDLDRYRNLAQEGAIAQQQLDSAQAAYDVAFASRTSAQAGVRQAQARLAQVEQGITSARAQLVQSEGGLQQARATGVQTQVNEAQYQVTAAAVSQAQVALQEAQQQLAYTRITAPTAGRIGRKTVEAGQRIQAGQPLLAVVEDQIWVVANFKETQLDRIQPGQEVEVTLDAFKSHPFKGKVESIAPATGSQFALLPPDNATGNFTKVVQRIPVKILLEDTQDFRNRLAPGMSAVARVKVKN